MSVIEDTNHVYHSIYEKRYALTDYHVRESRSYIQKNLEQLSGLGLERPLAGLNLATVGTGREVKAWAELGLCRNIHHFDISSRAVKAVRSISQDRAKIYSYHLDLCCSPDQFKEKGPPSSSINFIYLSGVIHHLEKPLLALQNLLSIAEPQTQIVLRVYRAGTIRWDLVALLRRVLGTPDPFEVVSAAEKLFKDLKFGEILGNAPAYYLENFIDNMIVPYCHLFDRQKTTDLMEKVGIRIQDWTDPASIGNTGHEGERNVSNGSTVFGIVEEPEFTANEISKLSSQRACELGLLIPDRSTDWASKLRVLQRCFEEKAAKLPKGRVLELALLATCLAEAPYIGGRFTSTEFFVDPRLNRAMSALCNAAKPTYSEAFCSILTEILNDEV